MGSAALALNAAVARSFAAAPAKAQAFLGAADVEMLRAIAPVLLDGALPPERRAGAIEDVIAGVEIAISRLPPATRAELRELFDLLGFWPARVLAAGVWSPWAEADAAEIETFLAGWRASWIGLLRTAYLALHELVMAAWYGNPKSWARIGYPGPAKFG